MTYSERGGAQDGHGEKIFPRDNDKVDGEPSQLLPLGTGARRLVRACDGWFGLVMAGVGVALHLAPVKGEHFEVEVSPVLVSEAPARERHLLDGSGGKQRQ